MKKSVKQLVENADKSRKNNPLDLSSDQDLTIALMNLVAIEETVPNEQVGQMVSKIRKNLMKRMIMDTNTWKQAYEFLAQAEQYIKSAEKAQENSDNMSAYDMYNSAYESYVLYLATVYGITT